MTEVVGKAEDPMEELERAVRQLFRLAGMERELDRLLRTAPCRFLAPIHRLPPEIVSEILLWTCVRAPCNRWEPYSNEEQLHILRVCKKWHAIAMNTPKFWGRLAIDITASIFSADDILSLENWLRRSGTCDIELSIDGEFDVSEADDESDARELLVGQRHIDATWDRSTQMVIDKLRLHTDRCTRIFVQLPANHINRLFARQTHGLPRLQRLSMLGSSSANGGFAVDFNLSACPKLADLRCFANDIYFNFEGEGAALRTIDTELDQEDTLYLLKCCPLVTRCDLSITEGCFFNVGEPALQLSHLTELRLIMNDVEDLDDFGSFFDQLCLPSLQTLSIWASYSEHQEDISFVWSHLTDLLRRSRPPLLELDLEIDFLSEIDLVETLSCVTDLRLLRHAITHIKADGPFWRALTMTDKDVSSEITHNLCPQLRTLKLTHFTRDLIPAAAEMTLTRCSSKTGNFLACKPLELLFLSGELRAEDAVDMLRYPGISSCMDTGLDIKLRTWDHQ